MRILSLLDSPSSQTLFVCQFVIYAGWALKRERNKVLKSGTSGDAVTNLTNDKYSNGISIYMQDGLI